MLNSSISPIKLHTQKTAGFINETSNTAADIYQDVSVKKLAVISKYNLIQLEFEVFNIPQMKKNKVFFKNVIYMVAEELSLKVTYTSWN